MTIPYVWPRPDPDWRDDAACRGTDPELFFGEVGESLQEAKAICSVCPVREECLEEALANNEVHGVFGGMSVKERRYERRKRLKETRDDRRTVA